MARFLYSDFSVIFRKFGRILLALAWTAGLLFGRYFAGLAGDSTFHLARGAVSDSVSAVSLYSCLMLPLLLSAFAVYMSSPGLLCCIAFGKGICFSWVVSVVEAAYGSSGWLIRFFFLFSDSLFLILLCCFWLMYADGEKKVTALALGSFGVAGAMLVGIDCWFIIPFLRNLLV